MALTSKVVKKLKSLFIDEHCIFYLKEMRVLASSPDNENIEISTVLDGIVLDIDECFYYLGLPDGTFVRTISHESAGIVEIAQDNSSPLLEMDYPTVEEEIH